MRKKRGTKVTSKPKKTDNQKIDKLLDEAWSIAVKCKSGYKCEYCGNTKSLNSHHVFSRANKSVRWSLKNGICLCVGHHIGVGFSAHKTPVNFTMWLIKKRGSEAVDLLCSIANTTSHLSIFEKQIILKELNEIIAQYQKND
jgi:5-methylcytosine-specific restriction endonuclease McrA